MHHHGLHVLCHPDIQCFIYIRDQMQGVSENMPARPAETETEMKEKQGEKTAGKTRT
jgi:hypothetical protein